jgi:hypothetical protein
MTAYTIFLFLFLNIHINAVQPDRYGAKPMVAINYNLSSPDKIYVLPNSLKEISGITETDASSVACIQDENGILFIYDLIKEQIKKQFTFHKNGDYEGIARVDKTIYVLRSDGRLFEINNYESADSAPESYATRVPDGDYEGLCFDLKEGILLIAPKSSTVKESENKENRFIYSFDLKSKKLAEKPRFVFELKEIKKFVLENKIKVPMKGSKKGQTGDPDIEFRTSAIGIHPITNRLFVISGTEKLLFVFDMNGKIEFLERLNPELFIQPEGITFLKNGDMLISNEGRKKKATILRFNYLRK